MPSFRTPIRASSSSRSLDRADSYFMAEGASATRRSLSPSASLVTMTTERSRAERCFLIALFTSASFSLESLSRIEAVYSPMPYHFESRAVPRSWSCVAVRR